MEKKKLQPDEEIPNSEYSFAFKKKIVRLVENGRISKNHASRKYGVGRSTIDYWCKKMSTLDKKFGTMENDNSPQQEIKKLKERLDELEFIKDFQQDIIAEFEKVTGKELSKKYLPKHLSDEIARKKKKLR